MALLLVLSLSKPLYAQKIKHNMLILMKKPGNPPAYTLAYACGIAADFHCHIQNVLLADINFELT